jgi:hypothetical protein
LSQLDSQPFPQPVDGEHAPVVPVPVSQGPLWHSVPHKVGASAGHERHTPLTQLAPAGQQLSPHAASPAGQEQVPMFCSVPLTMQALAVLQQLV